VISGGDTSDLDSPLLRHIDDQVYRWENSEFILVYSGSGPFNTARHRAWFPILSEILTSNSCQRYVTVTRNAMTVFHSGSPPLIEKKGTKVLLLVVNDDIPVTWVISHRGP
jgi:hypothetical protein